MDDNSPLNFPAVDVGLAHVCLGKAHEEATLMGLANYQVSLEMTPMPTGISKEPCGGFRTYVL